MSEEVSAVPHRATVHGSSGLVCILRSADTMRSRTQKLMPAGILRKQYRRYDYIYYTAVYIICRSTDSEYSYYI